MNILLIGSGRTGGAIANELLTLSYVDEFYLFSRTLKSARSLAYDLDDKKVHVVEDLALVPKIDYVIITLSGTSDEARAASMRIRTNTYELRQDELKYNIGELVGLIPFLKNLSSETKIIIVTNPVDELTNYLYQKLGNDRDIFGFGIQLDQRRLSEYLKRDVICVGTHGAAIPLINLNSAEEYKEISGKVDAVLFEKVRTSGIPHRVAAEEFKTYFEKLVSEEESIIAASYLLKEEFLGIKNISISLPFIIKDGRVIGIQNDLVLNKTEEGLLRHQVEQIEVSVAHIIESHKYLEDYR